MRQRNPAQAVLKLEGSTHGFTTTMKDRRAPRGGSRNEQTEWLLEYEDNQARKVDHEQNYDLLI
jgi:hypothetical protein